MKLTDPIGNTQSLAASLLLLGALFISACSLGFEHIGGFEPCQLCYVQRHIHYAMIPLSLFSMLTIMRSASATLIRLLFLGLAGVLTYGAVTGAYQAGAEWEWWLGPNDCTNSVEITADATNLLAQLQTTKLINCSVAQMRILGLSFGGWNVVLSTLLIGIALFGALGSKDALAPLFKRLPFLENWMQAFNKD